MSKILNKLELRRNLESHTRDAYMLSFYNAQEAAKKELKAAKVTPKTPSPIVHPPHYNQGKIETIEILKELTESYTGFEGFLAGNVVKYLSRANYKGNKLEDLKKAQFYLNRLVAEGEL